MGGIIPRGDFFLNSHDHMYMTNEVAADPQTQPTDLGHESACRLTTRVYSHHRHLLLQILE